MCLAKITIVIKIFTYVKFTCIFLSIVKFNLFVSRI